MDGHESNALFAPVWKVLLELHQAFAALQAAA